MRITFPELPADFAQYTHDITPAMPALSLIAGAAPGGTKDALAADGSARLAPAVIKWGFPSFAAKKLVINARAEGIEKKPLFSRSIREMRCVLPASGFYEWDREGQKVTFTDPDEPVIYLAGIYRPFGSEMRFVIITREANESMIPVHERMPLMIAPEDVRAWITDAAQTEDLLARPLPQLSSSGRYEQLSLF